MIIDNKITKIVGGGYEIAEVRYMDSVVWHKPTIVENPCEKSCQGCQTTCEKNTQVCRATCERSCQNCLTCQSTCEKSSQCGGAQGCGRREEKCGICLNGCMTGECGNRLS